MIANYVRAGLLIASLALAGCTGANLADISPKAEKQLPQEILTAMKAKGMNRNAPVMARIFKEEGKLEIWKQKVNGRYDMISSYDICKWSGELGPKFIEGDRQAPEGFYTVRPSQMNPKSSYHLAFNIGFPNAYDRVNGRAGANLMVHGACSSSGCYSMTDAQIEQIYAFGRDAFRGGQTEFQIQAFPFRMTAANMARYRNDPNYAFWKMLKEGYDHFEITKVPPKVDVCEKRYVFNRIPEGDATFDPAGACPASSQPESLTTAYQSFQSTYTAAFSSATGADMPAPRPSINGLQEAKLVSNWSKKKARGERVSIEPPSMTDDGTVVATARMGRIDSPAGRKQAALDAAAAEKAMAAEAKLAAARARDQEKKTAALAKAKATAPAATGAIAATEAAQAAPAVEAAAPEDKPGLLKNARKRFKNIFGS
jgi:murein L,D-transpeptidase YafK